MSGSFEHKPLQQNPFEFNSDSFNQDDLFDHQTGTLDQPTGSYDPFDHPSGPFDDLTRSTFDHSTGTVGNDHQITVNGIFEDHQTIGNGIFESNYVDHHIGSFGPETADGQNVFDHTAFGLDPAQRKDFNDNERIAMRRG